MAGDWIKVENVTPDKPEVFCIAESLGIDPDAVLGKLIRVWIWADQQTYDGNAAIVTRALLDRVAGVPGFADALMASKWLVVTQRGMVFPNFERHNGQSAKTRGLTARRVAAHKAQKGNDPNVTSALPREEKRRVNKNPLPLNKSATTDGGRDVDTVIKHYKTHHPTARPGQKERKKIRDRLKEGYTPEDLCRAIDGCHRSPHHCGQNERGTTYQSLELIVRDSTHVQQFLEVPLPKATETIKYVN